LCSVGNTRENARYMPGTNVELNTYGGLAAEDATLEAAAAIIPAADPAGFAGDALAAASTTSVPHAYARLAKAKRASEDSQTVYTRT
jgi:hypothetical protein